MSSSKPGQMHLNPSYTQSSLMPTDKGSGADLGGKKTLNQDVAANSCLYFYLFCVLGLVTKCGGKMIWAGAYDLAHLYGRKKMMPLFQLVQMSFSALVKIVISRYLINVRHSVRMTVTAAMMLTAYLTISIVSLQVFAAGFWISLFCALLFGASTSLGESTILGLLKGFPSKLVAPFSIGTGLAAVFASGLLLALGFVLKNGYIFLIATPLVFLYYINTLIVIYRKNKYPFIEEKESSDSNNVSEGRSLLSEDREEADMTRSDLVESVEIGEDASDNLPMSCVNIMIIINKIGWVLLNFSLVYLIEGVISSGIADAYARQLESHAKETEGWDPDTYLIRKAYTVMSFSYQIGVLIARSTLPLIKVRRIWIFTVLQTINLVFWFLNAYFFFLTNYYIMFVYMIYVGMLGGAPYSNIMYLIIDSKMLRKNEKELAVFCACIFCDIGVLLGSIASLILSNTVFASL